MSTSGSRRTGRNTDYTTSMSRGQDYSPETFVDPEGFFAEVERLEKLYLDQLASERR